MPTGYTAGILDGKVKTFSEFAKLCMKAFGACIHMRDDDMNAEYKPMIPSSYYKDELEKAQKELEQAQTISDSKIICNRKKSLNKDKKYAEKRILEITDNKNKLKEFLKEAVEYVPPTKDHIGVKKFMIEQLHLTIENDGKTDYHDKELIEIENQLNNIDPIKIRKELIESAKEEIKYCTKHYQEEVNRCNENDKWVSDFLKSLK